EYGYETKFIDVTEKEFEILEEEDDPEDLKPRTPIITVMGHVDHGKTTLLDYLRKTNVTSQEAGGITQHIGAYQVKLKSGNTVTFLDTPGHEAFTAMRARGAKATDVVIVVIAADDAVMPQTKEAINHAQAAGVPMIFALNKIDKPGADPERIKTQLAEMNLLVEDWGGTYQSQEISALKGLNVDELLEKVILEADLLELKANPDREASGTVIEARLDRGRGNVATVLVQNGTLEVGDELVAGIHYGKVRALINQNGERLKIAGPSTPVQVLGINGNPQAGDKFVVLGEDGKAKEIAQKRSELFREQQFRQTKRITLEEIGRRRAIGNFKELNIIIRGDVDGSVEALSGSLMKLSTDEVQVNIIQKAVGAITEADINLAIASDAIVLAFNVRPNAQARSLADREEVDIRKYSVIYDAINDVKDALEGLLSPEIKEEIVGTAEVKEVFKISKVGNVAGSMVTSGKIKREDPVRIIREGVVIYDSKLSSLKRFKEDVKEVVNGMEFGFMVENYNDIKRGDTLECYHINEIKRKL
ncbi:MAG: translation initiation factor IF-2, partial [Bacteroidetes bacterium]|nr:translation initiation factor IF-2 [Bacteroidota bacterium]